MPRKRNLAAAALFCFTAGLLLSFTLPKSGICVLAWFAPAALLYCARRAVSWKAAAGLGFVFGFAFAARSLFWIYHTCRFAGVSIPIALLAVGALACFLALSWALYAIAVRAAALRLPPAALPWVWALLWVALESAGARWTPRVGFDLLAYTQWRFLPLVQLGAFAGPHGLAFLIMAWNGALAELGQPGRKSRHNLSAAGILILLVAAIGSASLARRPEPKPVGDASAVEILQPNIDQYRKWDARFEADIRASLDGLLARPRAAKPALVLWPESALPGWLDEPENASWIAGWARSLDAPMIVGTVSRLGEARYNSAVLIDREGVSAGIYHKREMVPFGEYVPFRSLLQPWIGILAQMGEFSAGPPRQPLFETTLGRVAVTICYEAVFPRYGRVDAAHGARVFVNLTNDGWYKNTDGPYQHFVTNIFRAVENRATVIRAANTGISGMIDPWGVVTARTEIGRQTRLDVLPVENPFSRGSFYSRNGDWFGALAIFGALLLAAGGLRAGRRRA